MPIPSRNQVEQLVRSNAVLAALLEEGSIQIIYREPPEISDDRLSAIWRVDVLLLDLTTADLVPAAMRRLGFEVRPDGTLLHCKREWVLTTADRERLEAADRAAQQERKERADAARAAETADLISELQAQIDALKEDLELQQLIPQRGGRPGPAGPPGPMGLPGRDLDATKVKLSDLIDVSDEPPNQGWVLTWSDETDEWEPKAPRTGFASLGGGGGGSRLLSELEDVEASVPLDGQLLQYSSAQGKWVSVDVPVGGLEFWQEDAQGNLIPQGGNATKSIGAQGKEVKEIWVSGGTVYLDAFPLAVTNQGRITFDGNELAYGNPEVPIDADGGDITLP